MYSFLRTSTLHFAAILLSILANQTLALELDPSFRIPEFENNGGAVGDLVIEPNGNSVVVGSFTSWDLQTRDNIVRLLPSGVVDPSFTPRTNGHVHSIKRTAAGQYLITGNFSEVNGVVRSDVALLNADGSLDTQFAPTAIAATNGVLDAELLTDGKVLISGQLFDNNENRLILRLTANGVPDRTFSSVSADRFNSVEDIVLLADGHILISGQFTEVNGHQTNAIARLQSNGTVDTTFTSGLVNVPGSSTVRSGKLLIDSNQKLIVTGRFSLPEDDADADARRIARLNEDGDVDTSFDIRIKSSSAGVKDLVIDASGRLIVGGQFRAINGGADLRPNLTLVRFNLDGSQDTSFAPPITDTQINAIGLTSTGDLLVAGQRRSESFSGAPNASGRTVRVLQSGNLDDSFVSEGVMTSHPNSFGGRRSSISALAEDNRGRLIVAGGFARVNGVQQRNLVRLNNDGTVDADFRPSQLTEARSVTVTQNGKLLVSLAFPNSSLVQLNTDGSLDQNFAESGMFAGFPAAIAVQNDGKIIVARTGEILRLNSNGTPDASFNSVVMGADKLVLQPDGKIIVAGFQLRISRSGPVIDGLLRLNGDGSLDSSFMPSLQSSDTVTRIYDMALSGRSELAVLGDFTEVNGVAQSDVALLDADGELLNFSAPVFDRSSAFTASFQCDDRLVIGGGFQTVNGQQKRWTARFNQDYSLDSTFTFPDELPVARLLSARSRLLLSDGKILMTGQQIENNLLLARFVDEQNETAACYQDDELCIAIPKKVTFCL